jgi:hypothetical protein
MRARPALLCVTALIWITVAVKLDATAACRSLDPEPFTLIGLRDAASF